MGFSAKGNGTKSTKRLQFESRMKLFNDGLCKEYALYTSWIPFETINIVIRSYNTKYVIHYLGDIDHYDTGDNSYDNVKYDWSNENFLLHLLKTKK